MRTRRERCATLDRIALVVHRPLPYVYLAREVLQSAGVPCQMFDALPLAAEPYAAALDLVFSFVTRQLRPDRRWSRCLRSPHFRFGSDDGDARRVTSPRSIVR